ncbi:hypothetical protein HPB47_001415, partial [Ixodes persulcatus]
RIPAAEQGANSEGGSDRCPVVPRFGSFFPARSRGGPPPPECRRIWKSSDNQLAIILPSSSRERARSGIPAAGGGRCCGRWGGERSAGRRAPAVEACVRALLAPAHAPSGVFGVGAPLPPHPLLSLTTLCSARFHESSGEAVFSPCAGAAPTTLVARPPPGLLRRRLLKTLWAPQASPPAPPSPGSTLR